MINKIIKMYEEMTDNILKLDDIKYTESDIYDIVMRLIEYYNIGQDNEVLLPYITNSYKNKPITASEQIDYLYFKSFLNFVDKLFTFSITDGDSYDISGCPYIICGELLLVDHGEIINNPSLENILTATIENNILTIHLLNEDITGVPLCSVSFFVNLPPS